VVLYSIQAARKPWVMDRVDIQPVETHFRGAGCVLKPIGHGPCQARE